MRTESRLASQEAMTEDLRGQTILIVGCGYGSSAELAAQQGATRVVALDIDEDRLAAAQAAEHAGCIEYIVGDVEVALPPMRFDHVVCHDLLHRVRNPIAVLDRLTAATGTSLTLEVTGPDEIRPQRLLRRDFGALEALRTNVSHLPITVVGRHGTPTRKRERKFYYSSSALRNLMMEHRRHFASFTVHNTGGGRYVVSAVRRRIGELTVVSGLTGSGKSTFLSRLGTCDPDALATAAAAGATVLGDRAIAGPSSLAELPACVPQLLFHYDLLRPWRRDARVHDRDEVLDVFDGADRLHVLVLVAPLSVMCSRLRAELAALSDPDGRAAHRLRLVLDLYADPDRSMARVDAWLDFCDRRGASVHFIESSGDHRSLAADSWRAALCGGC